MSVEGPGRLRGSREQGCGLTWRTRRRSTRRAGGGEAEGGAPRQGILPSRRGQRGVEGGVPEEGDRAAFEWNMDRGGARILPSFILLSYANRVFCFSVHFRRRSPVIHGPCPQVSQIRISLKVPPRCCSLRLNCFDSRSRSRNVPNCLWIAWSSAGNLRALDSRIWPNASLLGVAPSRRDMPTRGPRVAVSTRQLLVRSLLRRVPAAWHQHSSCASGRASPHRPASQLPAKLHVQRAVE